MNRIITQDNHQTFKGVVCEFCLLLNFAYDDPAWKQRYQFDVWPTKQPMYSLAQHHFKSCRKPEPYWERNNDKALMSTAIFPFGNDPRYQPLMKTFQTPTTLYSMETIMNKRSQMLERFTKAHILADLSWHVRWNEDIAAQWYRCLRMD